MEVSQYLKNIKKLHIFLFKNHNSVKCSESKITQIQFKQWQPSMIQKNLVKGQTVWLWIYNFLNAFNARYSIFQHSKSKF